MNCSDNLQIQVTLGKVSQETFPKVVLPVATQIVAREPVISFQADVTGQSWSMDDYLVLEMESDIRSTITVMAEFCTGDTVRSRMGNTMLGGRKVNCCWALRYLDSSRNFPKALKGHLKCNAKGAPTDVSEIDNIKIHALAGLDFESLTIHRVYVTSQLPELTMPGEPMVDSMGQNMTREYKGKFASEEEMCQYLRAAYADAKADSSYPAGFDRFGGWEGLHFGATGHFYRHHDGKRWWLVDPDGNAFFSNGMCYGHRTGIHGMVDSFENLFVGLPSPDDPLLGNAYTTADQIPEYVKRNGLEAARGKRMFNFTRANMMRAFGNRWREAFMTITGARLKKWGFNTLSICVNDYNDEHTLDQVRQLQMPYCYTMKHFPSTPTMLYRDFPDVYDPEYALRCREFAAQLAPFAEDPYFIGYFITNEPEWMFQKDVNLAERTFAMEPSCATRKELVRVLQDKYKTIEALNTAWNTGFDCFEDLLQGAIPGLDRASDTAAEDFIWLRDMLIDYYGQVPAQALQGAAPHAMSLGMRYSQVTQGDFAGSERFDIFSFNCYKANPTPIFEAAKNEMDCPFLVGEWHIGAAEGGLLAGALINATTQAERGKACAEYMRRALTNESCVGTHYFELNDQPLLGRFDGENMQIGLVNICGVPYEDCVGPFAAMNAQMYRVLTGEITPPAVAWEYQPRF